MSKPTPYLQALIHRHSPFKELVAVCYESIPLERRTTLFSTRRRPRAKDKPVT